MPPILSVSVDLDEIDAYFAIHGLGEGEARDSRAVMTHAIPRFIELFGSLGVEATFFTVGKSLETDVGARAISDLVAAGHEIANHTQDHRYDLLRLDQGERAEQIEGGARAIEAATGRRPRGFRAPGYNIDDRLFSILEKQGYAYDSSVFPCPPYYGAKAAAMAAMRLRGRKSRSILTMPTVLLAPAEPYRVGRPYFRPARHGLVELPVAVLPYARGPFIGTALSLAGPLASSMLGALMSRRRFVGLELHGIDLLDAADPGMGDLLEHQPDAKIPLSRKTECFRAAITALTRRGARAVTCETAAALL